ncbi:transcription factor 23 [Protopterus annectens]|uniref:transcription factor 23 n=1 Tax=Protopterus annectens TaxID=7888 RepID=UPI001CFA4AA2|nr:transcription factor 23 [Protopterus annectens]
MEENKYMGLEKVSHGFSFVDVPEQETLPCKLLLYSEGRKLEESHTRPCAASARKVDNGTENHQKVSRTKQCPESAARERSRVRTLRRAFLTLQAALPSVPPDTKLSKLDVLVLATSYIAHLTQTLDKDCKLPEQMHSSRTSNYLHPMKVIRQLAVF